MKRLAVLASVAALAVGAGMGATASASAPTPSNSAGHSSDVRGVVPPRNAASKTATSGGNLVYHAGGSVMLTNKTYAIYWVPAGYSVSGTYVSTINQFFTDVAADSGKSSNVYYSDTQYYQGSSSNLIAYSSSVGGSVTDTNPFPASGCTDTVAQTTICISDAQIQAEIQRVAAAQNWASGPNVLFFMFTPKGVGSCYSSSSCAFSQYCAYHSHFGSGSSVTLYANQPYTDTVPSACDSGQSPNGDVAADSTINVASHEHNEAITDALGNAWYDRRGYENGDKCAWNFGGSTGSNYNQSINGHSYYLQQEWSNKSSGCVLTGY